MPLLDLGWLSIPRSHTVNIRVSHDSPNLSFAHIWSCSHLDLWTSNFKKCLKCMYCLVKWHLFIFACCLPDNFKPHAFTASKYIQPFKIYGQKQALKLTLSWAIEHVLCKWECMTSWGELQLMRKIKDIIKIFKLKPNLLKLF